MQQSSKFDSGTMKLTEGIMSWTVGKVGDAWEVVGHDEDGECSTVFGGPHAETRAREFAAWKNDDVFVIMRRT